VYTPSDVKGNDMILSTCGPDSSRLLNLRFSLAFGFLTIFALFSTHLQTLLEIWHLKQCGERKLGEIIPYLKCIPNLLGLSTDKLAVYRDYARVEALDLLTIFFPAFESNYRISHHSLLVVRAQEDSFGLPLGHRSNTFNYKGDNELRHETPT